MLATDLVNPRLHSSLEAPDFKGDLDHLVGAHDRPAAFLYGRRQMPQKEGELMDLPTYSPALLEGSSVGLL